MNQTTCVKSAFTVFILWSSLVHLLICYLFVLPPFLLQSFDTRFSHRPYFPFVLMTESSPSKLLQEIIGHKDFSHHFKCKTQKHSLGFVEDFHGNSGRNHGSVEAVIKGNEQGGRMYMRVRAGGCLGVGGWGFHFWGIHDRMIKEKRRWSCCVVGGYREGDKKKAQNTLKKTPHQRVGERQRKKWPSARLSALTWEDSLIFCSNSPPTRLYFSMHNANDSAAFLDFSSA